MAGGTPPEPKPFGGNVGKKERADGLKPGSHEAAAADRKRDADRKRRERDAKRAETPPPPLPADDGVAGPPAPSPDGLADSQAVRGDAPAGDTLGGWTADDFKVAAPELVELAEHWRITERTRQAAKHGFPKVVVEEYGRRAAFPSAAKKSLSNSSAPVLADMFNALKIPLKFKPAVATFPALIYLIVRDIAVGVAIEKQAGEEKERSEKKPEVSNA